MKFLKSMGWSAILIALCVLTGVLVSWAESLDAAIVQTDTNNGKIILYVSEIKGDIKKIEWGISSIFSDAQSIKIEDKQEVKTLFLIDTSLSITDEEKIQFQKIMTQIIDEKRENDVYAIATYNEKIHMLCDYSSDRYELAKTLESIEYSEKNSYIIDVLYKVLKEFVANDQDVYQRVVLFSDGGDSNPTGITNEELYDLLKENPYPIYTMGYQHQDNLEALKTLFSLSRRTSVPSMEMNNERNISEAAQMLGKYEHQYKIIITPKKSLADGNIKNLSLIITTSHQTYSFNRDVRMPRDTDKDQTAQGLTASTIPKNRKAFPIRTLLLAAGGCFFIAIIVLTIVRIITNKKRKKSKRQRTVRPELTSDNPVTELYKSEDNQKLEHTNMLLPKSKKYYIRFVNRFNPMITIEKPLEGEIIIGRDSQLCDIAVKEERSISKRHCRLFLWGNDVWIEDLGSSNKTFINEREVTTAMPLLSNSILRMGRVEYLILILEHKG